MHTEVKIAKKALEDKIESQVKTVQATLDILKARAESKKADAELKAIADLFAKKQAVERKLIELKKSESNYEQTKTDIESRVAELEKSVQAFEAKFRAA